MTPDAAAFIAALQELEQSREVGRLAELFSDDARVSNPLMVEHGRDGATSFWTAYRSAFDTITSSFSTILERDGRICLEWASRGVIDGQAVAYEGVSILEVAEDGIKAFRSYFDIGKLSTLKKADA